MTTTRRGRPSHGLSEAHVLVGGPVVLLQLAREAAAREGCSIMEWWRRAALGRIEASMSAAAKESSSK